MNHEKHERRETILYKSECYAIQGAVFEVYREMGCGFLENVYQKCLEYEFRRREIPFQAQKKTGAVLQGGAFAANLQAGLYLFR